MSTLQLLAADGNRLSAYVVKPEGTPRGAVVVVQEIFGVNGHIQLGIYFDDEGDVEQAKQIWLSVKEALAEQP